jgi:hypothetical protein
MTHTNMPFSAAASALGYLFQCRYALYESLRKLRAVSDFSVSIETFDDVVFEANGTSLELLQTKHHVGKNADLTDTSTDLWKSIRIWSESIANSRIPSDSVFFLITTATAANGSATFYLKAGNERNTLTALERLNATASSSTNQANEPGYTAFRALSPTQKMILVDSTYVIDAAPSITDLDDMLRQELLHAVELKYLGLFVQRLEGWWFGRVVQHLAKTRLDPILSEEILAEISRLREQFKEDNLPIDEDIFRATVDASGYQNKTFVCQLALIGIGNQRIFHAIRNYFRAFEQRSRWVREELLMVGDLSYYEEQLIEEWELHFEQMREELGDSATEDLKMDAARRLYSWVETGSHPLIKPRCIEPFVSRGSYQILADHIRVGWHPDFVEKLRQLLERITT